ncbi:creatinine amidohydrolase [Mycolicibacterium madagascariense]|uniref:Creatinine amidohydrolase n=1 Tax=Mycolicibacterium madagascariense TaxID=212765 RepID=A0A7I7XCJ1_9MYCO|nr:creatininase family protein [Mycolicibacterium madagascariense]MCV7012862.1 creatininase family protein [Mycolicibacterium madagascariense]BBZ26108.1 creatinine amidohydrolase [Mycolicibacterium madagascariense]
MTRHWGELSSRQLADRFATDPDTVVLIPVGATEQHGPHLPVGTDTIVAAALADAAAGDVALVLPPLAFGASQFHGTELAGTIACTGHETAAAALRVAAACADSGARRVLFVNGHVGNAAPLWIACDDFRHRFPDSGVGVMQWWELSPDIAQRATADAVDWHANAAETSLMLVLRPELVDVEQMRTADDPDRTAGVVFRYPVQHVSTNGVTGHPSRASKTLGLELWNDVVAAARAMVVAAHDEVPPLR